MSLFRRRDRSGARAPRAVTVYSRQGCHLCEDVIATAHRVVAGLPAGASAVVEVIDLDEAMAREPGLAAYSELVPVTLVDGTRVSHWHLGEEQLRAALLR